MAAIAMSCGGGGARGGKNGIDGAMAPQPAADDVRGAGDGGRTADPAAAVDLDALADRSEIDDLIVVGTPAAALSLPLLESVRGNVRVEDNAALTAIELPRLASVGGYVNIRDNAALATIGLPSLVSVGGHFRIRNNGAALPPGGSARRASPRQPDGVPYGQRGDPRLRFVGVRDLARSLP